MSTEFPISYNSSSGSVDVVTNRHPLHIDAPDNQPRTDKDKN